MVRQYQKVFFCFGFFTARCTLLHVYLFHSLVFVCHLICLECFEILIFKIFVIVFIWFAAGFFLKQKTILARLLANRIRILIDGREKTKDHADRYRCFFGYRHFAFRFSKQLFNSIKQNTTNEK